ncbi:hypothetical protein SAMN06297251_106165 [Fulvimarina manganoxydans]|uniref:Flagellar assembly protein FliH n=1 Tax=Fulvimarina manganoxydans TaxID=937218 RepID=A0A1W2BJ92_9HYPH|nr:hypothetical protein [Fulvimarina manganoxydans]SMC73039.1 hypothetical protein SAMN06297251_106165 [Fulvimarina manganoxydans]
MIPLAQYLTERDGESGTGFQDLGQRAPKRAAKPKSAAFKAIGSGNGRKADKDEFQRIPQPGRGRQAEPRREQMAASDVDAAALFAQMEDELRSRAGQDKPRQDARALQNELRASAPGVDSAKALDRAREAAYERGREEALAEAEAERDAAVAAAIEAEREAAAERQAEALAAARAEWCETESSQLAGALLEQTDRLAAALKVTLTSVLKPVALGARRRQTVAELVETVASLTFDGRALGLKASGSADLLEALEAALGARAGLVSFEPVDGKADVRIVCDQTVIETRLADWRSAFEKALA